MASEREEMERRRKKRAALRKKQLEEQRRIRRQLIAAAAILLICGIVIYVLTRDAGGPVTLENEGETGQTVAYVPEEATKPPSTPTTTIHIKAAGDLNVTDLSVEAGNTQLGYDYTKVFMDVAPVLSDADLTLMNFEGNLVGPPYGTGTMSAPQQMVEALAAAGVDILQMSNTYAIYNGVNGLSTTLNAIRAAGIEPVGAFSSNQEFERSRGYTICDIQGIKVAIVAFTKGMGGMGLPTGSENCVNKLFVDYETTYTNIDRDGIRAILKNVASEKPDVTIALVHWGSEYNDTIFKTQESIAQLLLDQGVDIILGGHSHLLEKVIFDDAANTLVAYSLGDFYGDASKSGSNYSIILDIQITRDNESGVTEIDGFTYTPIYTLSESQGGGQRRVVRIHDAMAAYDVNFVDRITAAAYESMDYSLTRIDDRVTGKDDAPANTQK